MITLYGVTETGTSVPVQVTADGRLVAQGIKGDPGESVEGPQGPPGPPGQLGPDDTVNVKEVNATDYVTVGEGNFSGTMTGAFLGYQGYASATREGEGSAVFLGYQHTGTPGNEDTQPTSVIINDGSALFSGGKCGFTTDGELIFTSRGATYRMIVQGNMLYPDPYDPSGLYEKATKNT